MDFAVLWIIATFGVVLGFIMLLDMTISVIKAGRHNKILNKGKN